MVIKYPFDSRFKSIKFVRRFLSLGTVCCCSISFSLFANEILISDDWRNRSPLCVPSSLLNSLILGCVQIAMPVVIAGLYWELNRQVKSSAVPGKNIKKEQHLIRKVSLESVSNAIIGLTVCVGFFCYSFSIRPYFIKVSVFVVYFGSIVHYVCLWANLFSPWNTGFLKLWRSGDMAAIHWEIWSPLAKTCWGTWDQ